MSALEPRRRQRRRRRDEDLPILHQTRIFDVKAEKVETESNEARVMELEAQVFEAERARERQRKRENALKAEISEAEEREWRAGIEGGDHVRFLGEKLRKAKGSQAKHEVEVREMKTKTNKAVDELRVDLVRFLLEES